MKPAQTPDFHFERQGRMIYAYFSPHPLKTNEGKTQNLVFSRECESELEACLLYDYLKEFNWEMRKHHYTEGYNAKKRKEQNWML